MNEYLSAMTTHQPLLSPPKTPVLLVFMPTPAALRAEVDELLDRVRTAFSTTVHVMPISELTHPEVVSSFGVGGGPAFVLLRQGRELWRHSGSIETPALLHQLSTCLPGAVVAVPNVVGRPPTA